MTTLVGDSAYRGYLGTGTPDSKSWFRGDGTWQYSLDISNAAGGQITFPATQNASAGANTLDDYEEGTFTPAIASSGGGAATYTIQTGNYTKIGDRVYYNLRIILASKGTLGAGTVTITGLPFTSAASGAFSSFSPFYGSTLTAFTSLIGDVQTSAVVCRLFTFTSGTSATCTVADLSATQILAVSGFYPT